MAITRLPIDAVEESTIIITAAFEDENEAAVTPDSIAWTLTDNDGTVINSRTAVAIAVPAASVDIVLSGEDLALSAGEESEESVTRRVLVEAVVDTDAGNDLPLKNSCSFRIRNLKYVT